jgi:hypothetical protein
MKNGVTMAVTPFLALYSGFGELLRCLLRPGARVFLR